MIDARTQEEAKRRLEASGVYLYARQRDGSGNVNHTVELDWGAALVRIAQLTGWGVGVECDAPKPADVVPIR